METSSPLRPNLNALIRTQSGSLIDHLSKQPTPAPTERDPDDCDDDTFDETDSVSIPPFINPLVTPAATPAKSQSRIQMNEVRIFVLSTSILRETNAHSDIFSRTSPQLGTAK
jgi:hypothetical protein